MSSLYKQIRESPCILVVQCGQVEMTTDLIVWLPVFAIITPFSMSIYVRVLSPTFPCHVLFCHSVSQASHTLKYQYHEMKTMQFTTSHWILL
jgi:hypothetical protein